jgi:TRAP transporter TAXI family solute receptor
MKGDLQMKLRKLMLLVICFMIAASPAVLGAKKKYSMGSGSVGGMFYLMGGGISTLLNNKLADHFAFTTESTGGGTANVSMIQSGDIELGITMASTALAGWTGSAPWTRGVKFNKLRAMVALYPSSMTTYCLQSSKIKKMSDLNGKIVGLGPKGAAMDTSVRKIFEKLKIKPKQIHNDQYSTTIKAISDGVIDAAIVFQNAPWPSLMELEGTRKIAYIPLSDGERRKIQQLYPFYNKSVIPGGVYRGAPKDVPTLEEWNFLICSVNMPESEVYKLTKTIYENNADLLAIHSCAKYTTVKNALNVSIPLHPGAIKYLKEKGMKIPAKLIPPKGK